MEKLLERYHNRLRRCATRRVCCRCQRQRVLPVCSNRNMLDCHRFWFGRITSGVKAFDNMQNKQLSDKRAISDVKHTRAALYAVCSDYYVRMMQPLLRGAPALPPLGKFDAQPGRVSVCAFALTCLFTLLQMDYSAGEMVIGFDDGSIGYWCDKTAVNTVW